MDTQAKANEQDKPRRFLSVSKADAGWFAFLYVVCFLVFQFDIGRDHPWFQNPMPTAIAALVAFPVAVVIALLLKLQSSRRVP
jgi:hypothetical protein